MMKEDILINKNKFNSAFNTLDLLDQLDLDELRYLVNDCKCSPDRVMEKMGMRWYRAAIAMLRLYVEYTRLAA